MIAHMPQKQEQKHFCNNANWRGTAGQKELLFLHFPLQSFRNNVFDFLPVLSSSATLNEIYLNSGERKFLRFHLHWSKMMKIIISSYFLLIYSHFVETDEITKKLAIIIANDGNSFYLFFFIFLFHSFIPLFHHLFEILTRLGTLLITWRVRTRVEQDHNDNPTRMVLFSFYNRSCPCPSLFVI